MAPGPKLERLVSALGWHKGGRPIEEQEELDRAAAAAAVREHGVCISGTSPPRAHPNPFQLHMRRFNRAPSSEPGVNSAQPHSQHSHYEMHGR